jgi:optic atrophy 3 protein
MTHPFKQIKELEPAAAFTRGADFLSETFIFGVGGGLVVFEYQRSAASSAKKEAEKAERDKQFVEVSFEPS